MMLTPAEFFARFKRAPGRAEQRFETYDKALLRAAGVDAETTDFLSESGLPDFVWLIGQFEAYDSATIDTWRGAGLPARYFPIGSNGAVSFVVIELDTGRIMKLASNWSESGLVNSSVSRLAESLCLLAEHPEDRDWSLFLEGVSKIDRPAAKPGCHWFDAVDDLQSLS